MWFSLLFISRHAQDTQKREMTNFGYTVVTYKYKRWETKCFKWQKYDTIFVISLFWVLDWHIIYFHPYLGKWSSLTSIFGLKPPTSQVLSAHMACWRCEGWNGRRWRWSFGRGREMESGWWIWHCRGGCHMVCLIWTVPFQAWFNWNGMSPR